MSGWGSATDCSSYIASLVKTMISERDAQIAQLEAQLRYAEARLERIGNIARAAEDKRVA